jgi:ABC-2 type transport system permease protein
MPIFDQGYQHWQGTLSGRGWRWLTIARYGVRAQMKNRWTRLLTLMAWGPAVALAMFLVLWSFLERQADVGKLLINMFGLSPEVVANPLEFRIAIWTIAYHYFFQTQITFAMILVLLVGPGLISQDLRFNAIPLYFSRPLRRFDYFAGKLGVIGAFLGGVMILPAVLAWVLGILFSLDITLAFQTVSLPLRSIAFGLVVVLSAGMLMLALSSLARSSQYVAGFWAGWWLVSGAMAGVLIAIVPKPKDWAFLVSYTVNLQRIGDGLFDVASAWDKLPATMRIGDPKALEQFFGPPLSWYWSALVLACLFGLSLWILTSRVRSLDRLK